MDHILLPHTVDTPPNEEPAFDEAEITNALNTINTCLAQTRSFDDLYDTIVNPQKHVVTPHQPDEDPEERFQDLLETLEFENDLLQRLHMGPEVSINREFKLPTTKHIPKAELFALKKKDAGVQPSPASDAMTIAKSPIEQDDAAPPSDKFVLDKKFVAIWVQVNPTKTYFRKTVWEADPLFHKYLRPLLYECGWTDKECIVPKSRKRCPYRGLDGRQCEAKNTGHHNRHMVSHLPDGIGYFVICPACKTVFRRADMFSRHKDACEAYSGRQVHPKFQDAYEQNIFLRLPWTWELEDLAREQRKRHSEREIQFWLPADEWVETDIRVPPTDKGRTKTPAGLNHEQPHKKVSKRRDYPKAFTNQQSSSRVKTINKLVN